MNDKYDSVVDLIFENPTRRFYVREVARLSKIHPNTVSSIVKRLVSEGIVLVERKRHVLEIFGNVENEVGEKAIAFFGSCFIQVF